MEELERQVREALIEQETEETYQRVMQDPELKAKVRQMSKMMMYAVAGLDENDEEPQTITEVLDDLLGDNPEQFKQTLRKNAEQRYMTKDELDAILEDFYESLSEDDEFGDEALGELKKANRTLYQALEQQKEFISKIVKIAKKEGIERAKSKETRIAIIRNMYPTADEFMSVYSKGFKEISDYFANTQRAMMMDGEIGKEMGSFLGKAQKVFQKTRKELQIGMLQKQAEEIYG